MVSTSYHIHAHVYEASVQIIPKTKEKRKLRRFLSSAAAALSSYIEEVTDRQECELKNSTRRKSNFF